MKRRRDINEQQLLRFARRHLSEAFPNPARIGCPSDPQLKSMAVQPQHADGAVGEHLTFCSPCFNRYLDLLVEVRHEHLGQKRPLWKEILVWPATTPLRIGAVTVAGLLLSLLAYFVAIQRGEPRDPIAPQPEIERVPVALSPFAIDLSELSPTRGSKVRKTGSQRPIRVPSSLLDLTLTLPLGSEEQLYRITLSTGGQVFWSQSAQAHLHNSQILIRTEADFTQAPPGSYNLEVESSSGIRLSQPVLIEAALPKGTEQE